MDRETIFCHTVFWELNASEANILTKRIARMHRIRGAQERIFEDIFILQVD
jgi:hypothetical protein